MKLAMDSEPFANTAMDSTVEIYTEGVAAAVYGANFLPACSD